MKLFVYWLKYNKKYYVLDIVTDNKLTIIKLGCLHKVLLFALKHKYELIKLKPNDFTEEALNYIEEKAI